MSWRSVGPVFETPVLVLRRLAAYSVGHSLLVNR